MIRSPIFEIKKAGWWRRPEDWLQIPIGAAAFFLALFLVTAVTSLAGSVLGEALSAPKAGLLLLRKADNRSKQRSVTAGGFSHNFDEHTSRQLEMHQNQPTPSE